MKKNVPGDHLEEFLINTFETYTESPSENVWERIAAETKVPPKVPFKVWRSYPLWIGAAVALLAGFIIYQVIYFNRELEHISRSVEEQQVEIQELQNESHPEEKNNLPQAAIENINTRSESRGDILTDVNKQTANFEKQTGNQVSPILNASQEKHDIALNKTNHSADFYTAKQINTNTPIAPQSTETIYPTSFIPAVGVPAQRSSSLTVANASNTFDVNHLANIETSVHYFQTPENIHIPTALPIQPSAGKSGLYLSINALPMAQRSKVKTLASHPFLPRDRKEFNQPSGTHGSAFALGVNAGTEITNHLSIESGLMYRTSKETVTHKPTFKYKERKDPPHGGGPRDCQFEYDLNTPTGTVALAITVEKSAASNPQEEEDIALAITSEQSLAYLSVPLLLKFQMGNGKLHLHAKGGVLTNFLLNNNFQITNISSNNNNFKPLPTRGLQANPLYFNQLSLDYLLQLGVAYDMTRQWSVQVEPTFIGSLTNASSNRYVQSSTSSVGVSAGVTWSF